MCEYSFVKKNETSHERDLNKINPAKVIFEHFHNNLHRHLNYEMKNKFNVTQ